MTTTEIIAALRRCVDGHFTAYVSEDNVTKDVRRVAAARLEQLQKELEDERHRHDRLQDWVRGLTAKYEELQEAFVDYVCSGVPNPAPYCKNKFGMCVNGFGWCLPESGNCRGFNPDGERRTND